MIAWLQTMERLLEVNLDHVIIFVFVVCGGLIFFADDVKRGVAINFFLSAIVYVIFRALDMSRATALSVCILYFILMVIIIYVSGSGRRGGIG